MVKVFAVKIKTVIGHTKNQQGFNNIFQKENGEITMTTKYKNVPMVFDTELFISDLRKEYKVAKQTGVIDNQEEWSVLCLEMEFTTVSSWLSPSRAKYGEKPLMGTFLGICNALGFDPRKYFCFDGETLTDIPF